MFPTMQLRRVGRTGLTVSSIALGTMTWGRDTDEHEARDQLTAFLDAGGTFVDTAASYGEGRSEELLGSYLGSVVARDDVVIATKAGIQRRDGQRTVDTSRGALLRGLETSLRRLGTDHVDLWQVHTWSDGAPLEETLSALDYAVSSGRASYVGISNYSGWQTGRATAWQDAVAGRAPIASTQMRYSLLSREIEKEVVPAALANGLGILPWSPLASGVLTGKYRSRVPSDSRAASDFYRGLTEPYLDERASAVVEAVAKAADGLEWTPTQVALAWVRDRPGVTAPIVGARTLAQLTESLRVADLMLPAEIADALEDVSAT